MKRILIVGLVTLAFAPAWATAEGQVACEKLSQLHAEGHVANFQEIPPLASDPPFGQDEGLSDADLEQLRKPHTYGGAIVLADGREATFRVQGVLANPEAPTHRLRTIPPVPVQVGRKYEFCYQPKRSGESEYLIITNPETIRLTLADLSDTITLEQLQNRCVELRKQDPEHEYLPVVGRLEKGGLRSIPQDCFPAPGEKPKCNPGELPPTSYGAVLEDTNLYGASTRVTFSTGLLNVDGGIAYIEKLNIQDGGHYGFCAEAKPRGNPKSPPSFYAHDFRTLQSITNQP